MADEEVKIEITATDKTAAAVASVKRNLQGIDQTASRLTTAFKGLEIGVGNAMRSFTTGMIQGAGMGAFNMLMSLPGQIAAAGGAAMQNYAQFERLGMSINSLTAKEALQSGQAKTMTDAMAQTSGKAKELVDWIEKLAIQSPFGESDVASTFRLSMAMGFTTKEAQRTTQALLDFAAATGSDSDKMVQLAGALGKIKTTGKISGEEIRQLSEAGLNATQVLADTLGKTPAEIGKMVSAGQVDAEKAIDAITASLEKFYGGAGARQAGSFSGILESLQQIQEMTGRNFFAPMFQGAQPYVAEFTNQLSSPEFTALVTKLGEMAAGGIGEGLATVVKGAQDVSAAIKPLLDAETPAWMTILAALFQGGGGNVDINLNPKVPENSGVTFDIGSGKMTFDVEGKPKALDMKGFMGELTTLHWDPATGLNIDFHGHLLGIEGLSVEDVNKWIDGVDAQLDGMISTTVTLAAEWGAGVLASAWEQAQAFFRGRPVQLSIIETVAPIYGPSMTPAGTTSSTKFPTDVTQPYPETSIWDVINPKQGKASGGSVRSGWAWVGERGAELINVHSGGVQVFSNEQSRLLSGGNVPGYADGSLSPGDVGKFLHSIITGASALVGLKTSSGPTYGPAAERGWIDFTKKGEQAMQQVAESATKAFEVSAKKVSEVFKSALGNVPGLNGLSQVTDLDMQKAKAGMKVSYADDYIRQLSDEVLNGKEWGANVDIKDAAKRAGIDPNLPNELILELVKQAWADKSFFANPANLSLINTGAVQADMEQQQKEARGSANLLGFFGLDNTNEATQAAALGQAIQGAFGAIPVEILSATGQTMMLHLSTGFTDPQTTTTAITNMGGALVTAMGTEAGAAAIKASGVTMADAQYAAYAGRMGELPPVPPSGTGTTTPPTGTTPPGKAIGAANYYGGWTRVHKDETIYLPQGANVYTSAESQRMGGGGAQVIQVTVASALDEEAVVNRIMQKIRRRTN